MKIRGNIRKCLAGIAIGLIVFDLEWNYMDSKRICICLNNWGDLKLKFVKDIDKCVVNPCVFLKINRYLAVFSDFLVICVIKWL